MVLLYWTVYWSLYLSWCLKIRLHLPEMIIDTIINDYNILQLLFFIDAFCKLDLLLSPWLELLNIVGTALCLSPFLARMPMDLQKCMPSIMKQLSLNVKSTTQTLTMDHPNYFDDTSQLAPISHIIPHLKEIPASCNLSTSSTTVSCYTILQHSSVLLKHSN